MRADVAMLLPDLRAGGAERVALNLCNAFAAGGLRVELLLMDDAPDAPLRPLLDPRVRVLGLGAARIRGVMAPLVRHLRRAPPRSLLAHMWPLTAIAVLARGVSRADTRVVVVEHTTWSTAPQAPRLAHRLTLRASMAACFRAAEGVVAVSRDAADDLARVACLPPGRVRAIPNPVTGGRRHAGVADALPEGWTRVGGARLLAVGALKEEKDYATLLHAFARLVRSHDARLLVAGEGAERPALEALADRLGVSGRVWFPGHLGDVDAAYARADLHVLSSRCEGFANVLVEAMAHGVPVVATDCRSGPREILADGALGPLVPVGDAPALAEAMARALGAPVDPARLRARAAEFSVGRAADAYLRLLLP
jgi:glycosyltransferase involved in cell wall biosynthesis